MTRKCIWCNKENEQMKEITALTKTGFAVKLHERNYFVCPEHEEKFRKFNKRVIRYALPFLGLIAISLLGLIGAACWTGNNSYPAAYLFTTSLASLGVVFFIFPFATPETIAMMGIAKSIKLVRIIGGAIFALGAIGLVCGLLSG